MSSELEEAIVGACPANEDRLHRGADIVVDPTPTSAAVKGKSAVGTVTSTK